MAKQQKLINNLRAISIFSESSDDVLIKIAENIEEIHINDGVHVFEKGDSLDGMYIIIEGSVKVHDKDYTFTTLGKNDFFGEYSLIDSEVRSASVTAVCPTKLLKINHKTLNDIISNKIEITHGLLKALIKRLRENNILEEQLAQRNAEIHKQQQELTELNARTNKFLAITAHDLRNSLNTIVGLSDMLKQNFRHFETDKLGEYLIHLNKYATNVFNLLKDLLHIAKSQASLIQLKYENINLSELIKKEFPNCKEDAKLKNIIIKYNFTENHFVRCDRYVITTVLRNLLNNAVKFSKNEGIINIDIKEDDQQVKCSISDTGYGINEADIKKLFRIEEDSKKIGVKDHPEQEFFQRKGTGLGLILCKELIEKQNGKISVISEVNKGSTFCFTLPKE